MPKRSVGLLLYRVHAGQLEVFLVHPGGPFWAKKDVGAWSIPKGEFGDTEDALAAARRELQEETGFTVSGPFADLGTLKQAAGKIVHAFVAEGTGIDPASLVSNVFRMEWPPRTGRWRDFPEVDRAAWFPLATAAEKINPAQAEFLTRLQTALAQAR